jgi:NAD(P)H-hydrate repair Nnr-like enzyme with NAD(P)H-hydrate epimerase domain
VIELSFEDCCEEIKSTCVIDKRSIQILGFGNNGGDGID